VAIQHGNGPGLSDYRQGAKGGVETVTLNNTQLPSHNHSAAGKVKAVSSAGNSDTPSGNSLAKAADGLPFSTGAPDAHGQANGVTVTVGNTGGNLSVENRQPYLALNYIIALQGVFPSRS